MALTKPFAENGDKKTIPENTTGDGSLSYETGFGGFYALPPEEGGLYIDRAQFNQLMYDTTSQVLENKQALSNLNSSTYNKTEVNNLLGVKADWNAVVKLTDDQTINGVKTFTSNITSPNITNLQNQMNSIVGSGNTPFLVKDDVINITAGTGGDFTQLTDALAYCKQVSSKQISANISITLLSDFSSDLLLESFPTIHIHCNGFKLANKLTINYSKITIIKLKIDKNLTAFFSEIFLYNGVTAGGDDMNGGFGSSIIANASDILIGGVVNLSPNSSNFGIFSKGNSRVYLDSSGNYTQTTGICFASVIGGGEISSDNGVILTGVSVPKSNVATNVVTNSGIIMGTIWN